MLTKSDLTQIKTVVGSVISDKLDRLDKKLIEHDINFKTITNKLLQHDKKFKSVGRQLKKIQSDLKIVINYFDHNCHNHDTRLIRIEKQLGIANS